MTKYSPAAWVIKTFGGVRKTARAIGRTPSAISKWTSQLTPEAYRGKVPGPTQSLVLQKAAELNLDITANDLMHGRELADT